MANKTALGLLANHKKAFYLGGLLFFSVIIAATYTYVINRTSTNHNNKTAIESIKETENLDLKAKRYEQYQSSKFYYISAYLDQKKYNEAEAELNTILDNVPPSRIDSATYGELSRLYKETNNQEKYKKYTTLLIATLYKENRGKQAEAYKNELKNSSLSEN